MSGATESRRGVALLIAIITTVIVGTCVLTLWHTRAAAARTVLLAGARGRARVQADSMLMAAADALSRGAWRPLTVPGQVQPIISRRHHSGTGASADITRLGWATLQLRGAARVRSGVAGVIATAESRVIVPLVPPMQMPRAALTGAQLWSVAAGASIDLATSLVGELRCRAGRVPVAVVRDSLQLALDSTLVVSLDPDTVTTAVAGVFRLTRDRITRPLVITGMVESVTGLLVGADLHITGVLVVRGSVAPAGGRLDVTGAIVTGDAAGTPSMLGNGDRVRYDACAIRHAVERASRPGPSATWTSLGQH